jgi:hypothetical protein
MNSPSIRIAGAALAVIPALFVAREASGGAAARPARSKHFSAPGAAAAPARQRLSPLLAERMRSGPGPFAAVVLLRSQEESDQRLGALSFAAHRERYGEEARRSVDAVLGRLRPGEYTVRRRFQSFAGFSGRFTAEGVRRLAEDPDVRAIVPEGRARPHRAEGRALMGVPFAGTIGSRRGAGVSVAVIDDGVDYRHPALVDAVVAGSDTGDRDDDPFPDQEEDGLATHGTAVAGIIAGRDVGVAPAASIVALKYSGDNLDESLSPVLEALDLAVMNQQTVNPPIGVISMSLGFDHLGFYTSTCDGEPNAGPFAAVIDRAVEAGIVVVASSGNEAKGDSVALPSCLSNVISVGAVYDADIGSAAFEACQDGRTAADQVTCYSNSADHVALLAPSHNCHTPRAGGGYLETFGGTSAAAPYASGVVALLMSDLLARGVRGTPAEYREALRATGRPIADVAAGGRVIPRIDVEALYRTVFR